MLYCIYDYKQMDDDIRCITNNIGWVRPKRSKKEVFTFVYLWGKCSFEPWDLIEVSRSRNQLVSRHFSFGDDSSWLSVKTPTATPETGSFVAFFWDGQKLNPWKHARQNRRPACYRSTVHQAGAGNPEWMVCGNWLLSHRIWGTRFSDRPTYILFQLNTGNVSLRFACWNNGVCVWGCFPLPVLNYTYFTCCYF